MLLNVEEEKVEFSIAKMQYFPALPGIFSLSQESSLPIYAEKNNTKLFSIMRLLEEHDIV